MKNKDILLLARELPKISPPNMDRWFNYAVQETIDMAKAKSKAIKDVIKPQEKMVEYQEELKKLQEKYAEKDEYGKPIKEVTDIGDGMVREVYIVPNLENPEGEFNVAVKKLEKKYKAAIDEYNEGLKFLEEENPKFEPYWVTMDIVPNGLSRKEFSVISLMLKKPTKKTK